MIILLILIPIFCILAIILFYLIDRFSYSKEYPYFDIPKIESDDKLKIGIIGDSWAARKAIDDYLFKYLNEKGIVPHIISSGHPGARTKKIYQNIFKDEGETNSSKFIIKQRPRYCIIIAGVNDAASQIGAKNYSYHIIQIIKTLLHYDIKPILVTLPEFGITEYINNRPFLKRCREKIAAYFNNNNQIDNIIAYREVLFKQLDLNNLTENVLIVDFDNVCFGYNLAINLYRDTSHLSKEGNDKLTKAISDVLINDIKDVPTQRFYQKVCL